MHSNIIGGGDQDQRAHYITSLADTHTELIHLAAEKSSITIKQIQDLAIPLSISPRLPRIVWIEEAGLMTIPAQNSLLKMLEEPPAGTSFFLTVSAPQTLLPTIRSRATLTMLDDSRSIGAQTQFLKELKQIMSLSPGDRLAAITKRDRSETLSYFTQLELELRAKLYEPNLTKSNLQMLAKIAKSVQQAKTEAASNCSVSLLSQHFYLTLPHTRSQA